uniref:Uncharacterized protein n=1 Tax=Arundo donax TaxID=35708 RepID=A0A0A8YIM3_ARUDO
MFSYNWTSFCKYSLYIYNLLIRLGHWAENTSLCDGKNTLVGLNISQLLNYS